MNKKNSAKKSQVTVFLIVAIVIILAILLVFFLRKAPESAVETRGEAEISGVVDDCLKLTLESALSLVGKQGGYYKPELFFSYTGDDGQPQQLNSALSDVKVSYYIYDSQNRMPSKEAVESSISDYIKEHFNECFNPEDYSSAGTEITAGEIFAKTRIFENQTLVDMTYPLRVKQGEKSYGLEFFSQISNARLGKIYELAKNFTEQQMLDRQNICLSCISRAMSEGVYTQILIYQDNTIIFIFTDLRNTIKGEYYDFIFANKY